MRVLNNSTHQCFFGWEIMIQTSFEQTTSGSNITILLDGAADFVTASASMLTLVLSEVGGTQAWREKSRRSY